MAPPETTTTTLYQTANLPEFIPDSETWHIWQEKLDIHLCEVNCSEENQKKAILLKSIGSTAYSLLHSLCSPQKPVTKTFKELCEILSEHYTPPVIIFKERKAFHTARRYDNETVAQWYARVKKLAMNCKFGDNLKAFLLDKFIIELPSKIFEKICEETELLSLENALKKAMILELKYMTKEIDVNNDVNYINKHKTFQTNNTKYKNQNRQSGNHSYNNKYNKVQNKSNNNSNQNGQRTCTHCGWRNHNSESCKYKLSTCNFCSKVGHLASICRSKVKSSKIVNYVSDSDNEEINNFTNNSCNFSIYSVSNGVASNLYSLSLQINGVNADIMCDTGAPCSLIPAAYMNKFHITKNLNPCTTPYVDYNGDKIRILGECELSFTYKGMTKPIIVVISDTKNPPLLGRNFLRSFKFELCQVNSIAMCDNFSTIVEQITSEFSELFDGSLGLYNVNKISLPIDNKAKPIFFKPRPLPFAWKDKIEKQLKDLVQNNILEPVHNSDWGTPLVPILKPNGDLRICGDYKVTINKYLTDFKYPLPRIEEIFASLEGGELFTKLDMSNAYNQLELDKASQLICTWSTHIGTFIMKRLPFGVKPAAAIFQKTMETLLRDISNVVIYQDDITVTGKNFQDHMKTLKLVLNRLQSSGLKLNLSKCAFFQKQISYLGFTIDKNGLGKNDERTSCIAKAPTPNNVSEVRAFIGMVNYHSKFINNFAQKMAPLYHLLQKGITFHWSDKCKEAYETIKKDITLSQVLVHFNPNLPIILSTDASNDAVAGVLSHEFDNNVYKPIAFVSRSLSKSERNYSTLQKEALAIIFCVSKLRQYLLGRKFILQTDHKPLITIFGENKGLPIMAAARMQRWAFLLSGFDYSIKYIKGINNQADGVSRIPQHEISQKDIIENSYICYIQKENALNLSFKDIAIETRRDPILSKVCHAIQSSSINDLTGPEYSSFRIRDSELSVEYGCVMWGYRTVIPTKLQSKILHELHKSHLGIVKTKSLARSYIWWPKIDSHIEDLIRKCIPCQQLQPSPEKSSLIPWTPSNSVWSRIHVDFAGPIKEHYFLIVVDSFSKWVEVFKTKEITTNFTITKLRELFCRYGIADVLVSDNGRQFTSEKFKKFMKLNNVNHILTPPGHPSTNGQAEIVVKVVKKSILANLKSNSNLDLDCIINRFLCDYRNTKHSTTGDSPAKLFFGRVLKTRFSSLRPPLLKDKIVESQSKAIRNHKGKRNINFSHGQRVFIRDYRNVNKPSWTSAVVKQKLGPRSYICIIKHNNKEIKRHVDQIRSNGDEINSEISDESFESFEQNSDVGDDDEHETILEIDDTISANTSAHREEVLCTSNEKNNVINNNNNNNSNIINRDCNNTNSRQLRPRVGGKVVKSACLKSRRSST